MIEDCVLTSIRDEVDEKGFSTRLCLTSQELDVLRKEIDKSFNRRLSSFNSTDHSALWPKSSRLLPKSFSNEISCMAFYLSIEEQYGECNIADRELNWRLVRQNEPSDVGPAHIDSWFWELGHGHMPEGYDRLKVWIAIEAEPGKNGLMVAPRSHRKNFKWHPEMRDGILKPALDDPKEDLGLEILSMAPGGIVIFHDRLMHAGAINRGNYPRVSLEFTMLYRQ